MLKLLVFLPCDIVIVSQEGNTSVITVLEQVVSTLLPDAPPNAAVPMKWTILSLWHRDEPVEGVKKYDQRINVYWPNGEQVFVIEQSFNVSNEHSNFRCVGTVLAFPVGQEGRVLLKTSLRESGDENEWVEYAQFPINVAHIKQEASNETAGIENAEVGGVLAVRADTAQTDGRAEERSGQGEGEV